MSRRVLTASALALLIVRGSCSAAFADGGDPPIQVNGGDGVVNVGIAVPGSPGGTIVQPVGGGTGAGPAVTCTYTVNDSVDPLGVKTTTGLYFERVCSDGTAGLVFIPDPGQAAPAGVPTLTPAQLAMEARDQLVLSHPTVNRSPDETLRFQGAPYVWANLSTWFWTSEASYLPLSHTLTVGPVSATVTAKPVGLLFDPGDGSQATVCHGPGRAWTKTDQDHDAPGGCSYRYGHVSNTEIPARVGILWQVSWTGTGGTGGTLPTMETITPSPLRVLQIQTVNK